VLRHCRLGDRKGIWPLKTEWWGAGVVICLERGAYLHMAQLMPLPLTLSCFSKIQIGFTFLVLAHPGRPGQRAVKYVCVLVSIDMHCKSEIFELKFNFEKCWCVTQNLKMHAFWLKQTHFVWDLGLSERQSYSMYLTNRSFAVCRHQLSQSSVLLNLKVHNAAILTSHLQIYVFVRLHNRHSHYQQANINLYDQCSHCSLTGCTELYVFVIRRIYLKLTWYCTY